MIGLFDPILDEKILIFLQDIVLVNKATFVSSPIFDLRRVKKSHRNSQAAALKLHKFSIGFYKCSLNNGTLARKPLKGFIKALIEVLMVDPNAVLFRIYLWFSDLNYRILPVNQCSIDETPVKFLSRRFQSQRHIDPHYWKVAL